MGDTLEKVDPLALGWASPPTRWRIGRSAKRARWRSAASRFCSKVMVEAIK